MNRHVSIYVHTNTHLCSTLQQYRTTTQPPADAQLPLLPVRRAKEGPVVRERLGHGSAFGVQIRERHGIAPPIWERSAAETQSEGHDNDAEGGSDIQSAGQDVVVSSYVQNSRQQEGKGYYFVGWGETEKQGGKGGGCKNGRDSLHQPKNLFLIK